MACLESVRVDFHVIVRHCEHGSGFSSQYLKLTETVNSLRLSSAAAAVTVTKAESRAGRGGRHPSVEALSLRPEHRG